MRTVGSLVNIALALFTGLVLLTDDLPTAPLFIALSFLLLAVPSLTAIAIHVLGSSAHAHRPALRAVVLVSNAILLAISCWAIVAQYPSHPEETGLLPYALLTLVAPALSLVVLARGMHPAYGPQARAR